MSAAAACPKCGRERAPAVAACPRCGLVFERWTGAPAAATPLDAAALALWAAVEAAWDDPEAHDRFIKRCSTTGALAAAGLQYRARLDRQTGDAVALRMQQRIVAMAALSLGPPAARAPQPVTRSRWFLIFIALAALGGAAFGIFYRR